MKLYLKSFLAVIFIFFCFSCAEQGGQGREDVEEQGLYMDDHIDEDTIRQAVTETSEAINEPLVNIDLAEIKKRGKLIALTGYSINSYFIYKGQPLGFEYELLKLLAEHLGVDLEIVIVKDMDQIFDLLNSGKGDLVAHSMTVTKSRTKKVSFTDHHTIIRQVLVQRLPEKWWQMQRHQIEKKLISNPINLIGKNVHVRRNSSYYIRLNNLSEEIGGDINIVEVSGELSTDELIRRVAEGEIKYTVADKNIALVNKAFYANIDVNTPVSLPQRVAWAVRKNSPNFKKVINAWLNKIKRKPTFNVLYQKYYENERYVKQRVESEFYSESGGKISQYDGLIKQFAQNVGWDWRMLASQIYQESKFDPEARSWMGARGLLQLMPRTARQYGVEQITDPVQNLAAGTKFLNWLAEYWKEIPDSTERLKFVLASFNVGQGHVEDAQRLAKKHDKDPHKWGNIAEFLVKKSTKTYYNDEVVKYGYCRGREPVNYVEEILDRYQHYQKFIAS